MGTPSTLQNVDDRGYVFVTEAADCQIVTNATSVGTSATKIPADNLPERRRLYIKNPNATTAYLGGADVTTSNGYPLPQDEKIVLDLTDDIQVYGIASSTVEVRSLELA